MPGAAFFDLLLCITQNFSALSLSFLTSIPQFLRTLGCVGGGDGGDGVDDDDGSDGCDDGCDGGGDGEDGDDGTATAATTTAATAATTTTMTRTDDGRRMRRFRCELVRNATHPTPLARVPTARASVCGARGLTTEDGARSKHSSSAGDRKCLVMTEIEIRKVKVP